MYITVQRTWKSAAAVIAATLILSGCGASNGNGEGDTDARELKFAFEGAETTAQGLAADIFQEALEEASGGQMTITQAPNGQLGSEPELLEQVRGKDLDLAITSTANAAQVAAPSAALSLHYVMADSQESAQVFSSDSMTEAYQNMAEEHVTGAQPLTLFMLPVRNLYSDTEIRSPEDLQNMTVRVQPTSTEAALFKAYGAQPIQMAFPELYSSLQTGVVDAAENAITYYTLNNHHEVAPVMSMTGHATNGQALWVSDSTWESLSDEEQEFVTAAAEEVRHEQPARAVELEEEIRAEYEEKGILFVDDVDVESFQEIAVPLQDELAEDIGPEAITLLEEVRSILDN